MIVRLALHLLVLSVLTFALAGGAAAGEQICRGNNPTAQHVRDASKYALEEAKKRGVTPDDATYVTVLEEAFDSWMTTKGDADPLLFRPISGPVLAADSEYAHSLARLFQSNIDVPAGDDGRVIGGCPAEKSDDVVAIMDQRNRRLSLCSGILIKKDRVLTAAHCVCPILDGVDKHKGTVEVRTGRTVFARGTYQLRFAVHADILMGRDNCPKPPATFDIRYMNDYRLAVEKQIGGRDLAVLRLDEDVTISAPREILSAGGFLAASGAQAPTSVVGYGFVSGTQGAGERRWGGIAVADWRCSRMQRRTGCSVGKELVAAERGKGKNQSNTATCNHDSGGPLYVFDPANKEPPKLAAITSRNVETTCGRGAIYGIVSTSEVLKWLSNIQAVPP